jgi:DNA-directed RNA polymerase specialized sigma24 family protein
LLAAFLWRYNGAEAGLSQESVSMDEGQQIALDILREENDAWERFQQAYSARLLARAVGLRRSLPPLRHHYQAEDLVQDFLKARVVLRPKWDRMFGPASRGEKPLWPLLCRSLIHHCLSLHRRLAGKPKQGPLSDLARQGRPDPSLKSFTARAASLISCIREALPAPSPGAVAFGHLLLLQVRLEVLQAAAALLRGEDGALPEGVSPPAAAQQLSPWTPEEEAQPLLPDSLLTLGQAWNRAVALAQPPFFEVTITQTAGILGIPVNTLNVYRKRARQKLLAHHGPELFDRFGTE